MKPTCCGKSATPYQKWYDHHSVETGFRCRKCGRIRIPFESANKDTSFMDGLDAFREEAIAFWSGIDFDIAFPALIKKRRQFPSRS